MSAWTDFLHLIKIFIAPSVANRFMVRDYNPDEAEKQKQEMNRLAVDRKELCVCKTRERMIQTVVSVCVLHKE